MIRLTKININPNSPVEHSKTVAEYRADQERGTWGQFFEGKSPPIDYWIEGYIVGSIEVGKQIIVDRRNRNGVEIRGLMTTSPLVSLEEKDGVVYATTQNSVYKLEEI